MISVNAAALVCVFGFRFFFAGSSHIVISGEESLSAAGLLCQMISIGHLYRLDVQHGESREILLKQVEAASLTALNWLGSFTNHHAAITRQESCSTFSFSVQVDNIFEVLASTARSRGPHAVRRRLLPSH